MIFYVVSGVVAVALVVMFLRSAMSRQLRPGRGVDAGRFGSQLDHFFDNQGTGQGWKDDGRGARSSHIDSQHTRRRGQENLNVNDG